MNHLWDDADQGLDQLGDLVIFLLFPVCGLEAHKKFDECADFVIQWGPEAFDFCQDFNVASRLWPIVVAQNLRLCWSWRHLNLTRFVGTSNCCSLAASVGAVHCVILDLQARRLAQILQLELLCLVLICCQITRVLDYLLDDLDHFIAVLKQLFLLCAIWVQELRDIFLEELLRLPDELRLLLRFALLLLLHDLRIYHP